MLEAVHLLLTSLSYTIIGLEKDLLDHWSFIKAAGSLFS
jgi:hypothetical protein